MNQWERYLRGEVDLVDGKVVPVCPGKTSKSTRPTQTQMNTSLDLTGLRECIVSSLIQWGALCKPLSIQDAKITFREEKGFRQYSCPIFHSHSSYFRSGDDSHLQAILSQHLPSLQHLGITSMTIDNHFLNFHTNAPISRQTRPTAKQSTSSMSSSSSSSSQSLKPRSLRMELVPALMENVEGIYEIYQEFERDQFNQNNTSFDDFYSFLGGGEMELDKERKLGTFWWKWYIDDELVAVSVLDILPNIIVGDATDIITKIFIDI